MQAVANPYLDEFLKVMAPSPDPTINVCDWIELDSEALHRDSSLDESAVRKRLVQEWAWAVPNDCALEAIAALEMPVVEIGAGLGYWHSLLEHMDVSGMAFDEQPGNNKWCKGTPFTQVYPGDHRALEHFTRWCKGGDHALMLCWPPMSSMASECVEAFKGDTLVYIGEGIGGCTANDKFFEQVTGATLGDYDDEGEWQNSSECATSWEEVVSVDIPRWRDLNDYLTIWRR